jgi:MSHA pilin protein MshD
MRHKSGFTLVELIIFIVILLVGIAGILLPIMTSVRSSADPMIARQMVLIADSLMDEIMARDSVTDPCTGTTRADYDAVLCYSGYSTTGISAMDESPIAGLDGYSVAVAVNDATLPNVEAGNAKRITITVTQGSNSFALEGYRLAYE